MSEQSIDTRLTPRHRIWEKAINSFLTPTWLWNLVIRDYTHFHSREPLRFTKRVLQRFLWFWPRLLDAVRWRDSGPGHPHDPKLFEKLDQEDAVLTVELMARVPDKASPILDLGCNCGRYLNYLAQAGYINLHGVDVSKSALEYMDQVFPGLKQRIGLSLATFQEYLLTQPDRAFEAVFSRGATVELVHPSFPLVRHLARVTRSFVLLMIQENGHSYPRFWEREFLREGFLLVKLLRPALPEINPLVSLLVFQRLKR